MVATNMDGRTLFDGAVPAGDEVVSGIVTELLVARAIGGLGEDVKVRGEGGSNCVQYVYRVFELRG